MGPGWVHKGKSILKPKTLPKRRNLNKMKADIKIALSSGEKREIDG
jgi:hypothetical protein